MCPSARSALVRLRNRMVEMGQSSRPPNRYQALIARIFLDHWTPGITEFEFEREEFEHVAEQLGIKLPKNIGDVTYSFRYRSDFPDKIRETQPAGRNGLLREQGARAIASSWSRQPALGPGKTLLE